MGYHKLRPQVHCNGKCFITPYLHLVEFIQHIKKCYTFKNTPVILTRKLFILHYFCTNYKFINNLTPKLIKKEEIK